MGRLSELLKPQLTKPLFRKGQEKVPKSDKSGPGAGPEMVRQITVDAGGWRISDETGTEVRAGRAHLPIALRDGSEPLKNLEEAFAALGSEATRANAAIELFVSDPQIEVLDNRLIRGGLGDRESAARLAREVLGRDESAFDVCDFGETLHGHAERKVIAAAPLDRIRDYLLAAGDLAIAIRSISPLAAQLVTETAGDKEDRGVIEIGMRQCQIILTDRESGAIVQRVIPTGIADMAERLAEAQTLSADDALAKLGERDFFARLPTGPDDSSERPSRSEEAILSIAAGLLRDLSRTVEDFSENRMADAPHELLLSGVHGEAKGFADWLSRGLKLGFSKMPQASLAAAGTLNLLRGTTDALIVRGKTRYRFKEDRFVPLKSDDDVDRAQKKQPEKPGRGKGKGKDGKSATDPGNAARNKRALMMAGVAGGGLLCMLAWDHLLAPASASTQRGASALTATVDRSMTLQSRLDELIESHAQTLKVRSQASNKILWTEKFLAISDAIPAGLWLTDTAIIQDERSIGTTDVITTKLRIRGQTVLDERRNLADVAALIQGLEADDRFMSDFRQVTFEGMSPVGDGTLKFEIHAWYDQNKRKSAATAEAGENNGGAIGKLRQQTDARARTQDELLNINPRSAAQN